MEKTLQCECGFVARGESENDLAARIRRHALDVHRMALSDEEALLLASGAHDSSRNRSLDRKEEE